MYKLYHQDKVVVLDDDARGYAPDEITVDPPIEKANLLQKIQNTKRSVWIVADVEAAYRSILDLFPSIEAAGGLVTDPRGGILMIHRHRRWDLPKGKLEPGERIEDCAVREVEEETGIVGPEPCEKLIVTTHFYRLEGRWTAKQTTWYAMTHPGDTPPVPQTEEGIEAIEWVDPAKLDHYLRTTYPTIVDVFEAAGYRVR